MTLQSGKGFDQNVMAFDVLKTAGAADDESLCRQTEAQARLRPRSGRETF
jgi:hypothetical protein